MVYEVFKEKVEKEFVTYFEEGTVLDFKKIDKVNAVQDAVIVKIPGSENVFPTIYVNGMYERYMETGDFDAVMKGFAKAVLEATREVSDSFCIEEILESVPEKVILTLVNTAQNEVLLKKVPSRAFLDLSIVYRIVVEQGEGFGSIVVTNEMLKKIGLTEEQLYQYAYDNTRALMGVQTLDIFDKVCMDIRAAVGEEHLAMYLGVEEDELEQMIAFNSQLPEEDRLYVVSNDHYTYGAALMLYKDVFSQLSEKICDDLYILPSSVHETLAIGCRKLEENPEDIAEMVHSANMGALDVTERLSNQVYKYSRASDEITLVTDSCYKSLVE